MREITEPLDANDATIGICAARYARIQLFVDEQARAARANVRHVENVVTRKLALNAEIPNVSLRVLEIRRNRVLTSLWICDEGRRQSALGEVRNTPTTDVGSE